MKLKGSRLFMELLVAAGFDLVFQPSNTNTRLQVLRVFDPG